VDGKCGGGKCTKVTGRGRQGEGDDIRGRESMKKGRKNSWWGEKWTVEQEKERK
jgi:hypothetical protein